MKYLNVNYSPNNQKVNSDYIWNDEEKDFSFPFSQLQYECVLRRGEKELGWSF